MNRLFFVGLMITTLAATGLASSTAIAKSDKASKNDKAAKVDKKEAEKKTAKDDKTVAGGKLIENFEDWTASVAQGKVKTCYALSKPKERAPEGKREQAYIFIADRPGEKVHAEVSFIMGFPIKDGSAAKAKVGKTTFDLVAVSNAFFMKETTDDAHFVDALKHGGVLVLKAPPVKGPVVTDTYSLKGFRPALDRAQKECR